MKKEISYFRQAAILVILFAAIRFGWAATQTINTLPSANATFIADVQTFLGNELANYLHIRFGNEITIGGLGATDASLTHTVSAIVGFPNGFYVSQAATSHTYTATKRTFVYVRDSDSRTITIGGAAITYDDNLVFAETTAATTIPITPTGCLPLFYADTDGTSITAVTDLRSGEIAVEYFDDFEDAVDNVGANQTILISQNTWTGTKTATQRIHIAPGGRLLVEDDATLTTSGMVAVDWGSSTTPPLDGYDGGESLTINGGFICPPDQQAFDGSNLTVTGLREATPELFGIDGTADETEINYASAAVETNRGVVHFIGPYTISGATPILVRDYVTYTSYGSGYGRISFVSGVGTNKKMITNDDTGVGNTGFTISNLTLDADRANNEAVTGLVAIELFLTTDSWIHHNRITGFTSHGIEITGQAANGSTDNIIESNIVDDYGNGLAGACVMLIRGASRNIVRNNHCTSDQTNDCIDIDDYSTSGDSYDSSFNSIIGNHCTGANNGLLVQGCTNNLFIGNILKDQGSRGILTNVGTAGDNVRTSLDAQYNMFQGNFIYSPASDAIRIIGDYNTVDNNFIYDAGGHAVFGDTAPIFLSVTNNKILGYTTNAIRIDGGQQFNFSGNQILGLTGSSFGDDAIYLTSGDGSLKWGKVSTNVIHNAGGAGIMAVANGSQIFRIEIDNNTFLNVSEDTPDADYCITLNGNVDGLRIHNNSDMQGSDSAGMINFVDSDSTNNLFYGNGTSGTMDWDFTLFGLQIAEAESGTLTGATDKINTNIPSGSQIIGITMNNEVVVSDDAGDDTYTAALSNVAGGSLNINGGAAIAAAADTKTKELFSLATSTLTTGESDITLTPNGGDFSGGNVRARVWYMKVPDDMPDAP